MRYLLKAASWLIAASLAATAFGHGSPIHIDVAGATLVVSGGLPLDQGFVDMAFDPSEEAGLDFPGLTVRDDLPGFDLAGVPAGSVLQLEVLPRIDYSSVGKPQRWLWFWDPTTLAVEVAANDPDFAMRRKDLLGSLSFDQFTGTSSSVLNVTDSLTPNSHQHYLRYELDNSPAAAFGVYAVFVRAMAPGFEPSKPFLMAFRYGVGVEEYALGAEAINVAAALPGDFNLGDTVDAADYTVWRDGLGTTFAAEDYDVWKSHFGWSASGNGSQGTGFAAVPEPSGLALSVFAIFGALVNLVNNRRLPSRQRGIWPAPISSSAAPAYDSANCPLWPPCRCDGSSKSDLSPIIHESPL